MLGRWRTNWQRYEPRMTTGAFGFCAEVHLFGSDYFRGIANARREADIDFKQIASGGRCQWVLDAVCRTVEWLSQPLRFNSVVLRTALDFSNTCQVCLATL
jgi:hypothetical protein